MTRTCLMQWYKENLSLLPEYDPSLSRPFVWAVTENDQGFFLYTRTDPISSIVDREDYAETEEEACDFAFADLLACRNSGLTREEDEMRLLVGRWISEQHPDISTLRRKRMLDKLTEQKDVMHAVCEYIRQGTYNNTQLFGGYTAADVELLSAGRLDALGVFGYCVYLNYAPEKAARQLLEGLPASVL